MRVSSVRPSPLGAGMWGSAVLALAATTAFGQHLPYRKPYCPPPPCLPGTVQPAPVPTPPLTAPTTPPVTAPTTPRLFSRPGGRVIGVYHTSSPVFRSSARWPPLTRPK